MALRGWAAPDFGETAGHGPGDAMAEKTLRDPFLSVGAGSHEEFGEIGDRGSGWAPAVWVRGLPPGSGLWHATPNGMPFRSDSVPNNDQPIAVLPETPPVPAGNGFVAAAGAALPPAVTPESAAATTSSLSVSSKAEFASTAGGPSAAVGGAASVVTPEPASFLLFGSGLALAALRARARKRRVPQP